MRRLLRSPGESSWWIVATTLSGLMLPSAVMGLAKLGAYFPIGTVWPFSDLLNGGALVLVGLGLMIVVLAGAPLYAFLAWSLRPLALGGLFFLALIFGVAVGAILDAWLEHWAFTLFARRSAGLIAAIERYDDAKGRPPAALAYLLPDYRSAFPDTGMRAYRTFAYAPNAGPCSPVNKWHLTVPVGLDDVLYCPMHDYEYLGANDVTARYDNWALIGYPD